MDVNNCVPSEVMQITPTDCGFTCNGCIKVKSGGNILDGIVGEILDGVIENSGTVLATGEIFCLIVSCLKLSCGRVVSDVTTTGKGGVVTLGVTVGVGSKICSFVDVVRN